MTYMFLPSEASKRRLDLLYFYPKQKNIFRENHKYFEVLYALQNLRVHENIKTMCFKGLNRTKSKPLQ